MFLSRESSSLVYVVVLWAASMGCAGAQVAPDPPVCVDDSGCPPGSRCDAGECVPECECLDDSVCAVDAICVDCRCQARAQALDPLVQGLLRPSQESAVDISVPPQAPFDACREACPDGMFRAGEFLCAESDGTVLGALGEIRCPSYQTGPPRNKEVLKGIQAFCVGGLYPKTWCEPMPLCEDLVSGECCEKNGSRSQMMPGLQRGPDGYCVHTQNRCLAPDTRIATPIGDIPVRELKRGDRVWTRTLEGHRVSAEVIGVVKAPLAAPHHHVVVRLELEDGRALTASPGHPLADGRRLEELAMGDLFEGVVVVRADRVPYEHSATYDILPAGKTGIYWADGIALGSTLTDAQGSSLLKP